VRSVGSCSSALKYKYFLVRSPGCSSATYRALLCFKLLFELGPLNHCERWPFSAVALRYYSLECLQHHRFLCGVVVARNSSRSNHVAVSCFCHALSFPTLDLQEPGLRAVREDASVARCFAAGQLQQ
jgi:hypothetical protein